MEQNQNYHPAILSPLAKSILTQFEEKIRKDTGQNLILVAYQGPEEHGER